MNFYLSLHKKFGPDVKFWNLYGQTEISIWSSCVQVTLGDERVPIYRPQDSVKQLLPGIKNFRVDPINFHLKIELSPQRQCFVNDLFVTTEFDTHDIVETSLNSIYFSHRETNFKRNGKIVCLDKIRRFLMENEKVEDVHIFTRDNRIIAAVFTVNPVANYRDMVLEIIRENRKKVQCSKSACSKDI